MNNNTDKLIHKMKNSEIEWLGLVPFDWKKSKYKFFTSNGMGETILSEDLINDGKIPVYSATQTDKIFGYVNHSKLLLSKGDLVIPARGNSIGAATYIKDNLATCTQTTIYSKVSGINNKFLYYCTIGLKDYWFNYDGSAIPQITVNQVKNNILFIPSKIESSKIVEYLDDQVSLIDNLIEEQKVAIEKWKEYKESLITETVTKGLNPDVHMKGSGIKWIGEIPSEWNTVFINQMLTQLKNKNIDMKETNLLSLSYGKIVKKNIETKEGLLPENFSGYNIIDSGDIVLRLTDLQNDQRSLRCGIAKERGIITSAYVTLRNIQPMVNNYYYYLIHSYDVMKVFYGMGSGVRQGLTFDGLKKMRLLVPPIDEQQQIADFLDEKCSKIYEAIEQKQVLIKQLEEYKQSLIYECVTGKKQLV